MDLNVWLWLFLFLYFYFLLRRAGSTTTITNNQNVIIRRIRGEADLTGVYVKTHKSLMVGSSARRFSVEDAATLVARHPPRTPVQTQVTRLQAHRQVEAQMEGAIAHLVAETTAVVVDRMIAASTVRSLASS